MQQFIIKTNNKISLKIPAYSKFVINAIFLEDLNIENVFIILPFSSSLLDEKLLINLKNYKLYWNEINKSEILWRSTVDEQNSIYLESNLNIYVNINFRPTESSFDLLPLNFNEEKFLIINRLFCNQLSFEDCPNDFFQCYNHQKNKNINFCSLYSQTNLSEITEIEKNYRNRKKQILLEFEKKKQLSSNEYNILLNKFNNNKFFIIILIIIILILILILNYKSTSVKI